MVFARRQLERQTASVKIVWKKKREILKDMFHGDSKKTDQLIAIKRSKNMFKDDPDFPGDLDEVKYLVSGEEANHRPLLIFGVVGPLYTGLPYIV